MDTNKDRSLWQLAYERPPRKREQSADLPGPLFDVTVLSVGIVSAITYLVY